MSIWVISLALVVRKPFRHPSCSTFHARHHPMCDGMISASSCANLLRSRRPAVVGELPSEVPDSLVIRQAPVGCLRS